MRPRTFSILSPSILALKASDDFSDMPIRPRTCFIFSPSFLAFKASGDLDPSHFSG